MTVLERPSHQFRPLCAKHKRLLYGSNILYTRKKRTSRKEKKKQKS